MPGRSACNQSSALQLLEYPHCVPFLPPVCVDTSAQLGPWRSVSIPCCGYWATACRELRVRGSITPVSVRMGYSEGQPILHVCLRQKRDSSAVKTMDGRSPCSAPWRSYHSPFFRPHSTVSKKREQAPGCPLTFTPNVFPFC